jgi:uncharacterized protein (TIGR03067 family)
VNSDLELLQGTWTVTDLEVEGRQTPGRLLADARVVVKGSRFTTRGMGAIYKGTIKLDPSATPRQVDMQFDAGPEKGNTNLGIYKIDANQWRLCLAMRGTVRPSRFASEPGTGFALETLTRQTVRTTSKPQPARRKKVSGSNPAATEFEGEWQMVSAVMNGAPMEDSDVQWVKRTTAGAETIVKAGPQTIMRMTFTHDPSTSPKTIRYVNTAGANKGKTQLGIYEFEGDLLRICMSAPGAPPPAGFQSKFGDGATLTVWKKSQSKQKN